ncbi:MAG: hypothetical protein M3Q43_09785 [Actinomycetota bacterium]|nr:hypothetical protein [Actinomycetota bacterium]
MALGHAEALGEHEAARQLASEDAERLAVVAAQETEPRAVGERGQGRNLSSPPPAKRIRCRSSSKLAGTTSLGLPSTQIVRSLFSGSR